MSPFAEMRNFVVSRFPSHMLVYHYSFISFIIHISFVLSLYLFLFLRLASIVHRQNRDNKNPVRSVLNLVPSFDSEV